LRALPVSEFGIKAAPGRFESGDSQTVMNGWLFQHWFANAGGNDAKIVLLWLAWTRYRDGWSRRIPAWSRRAFWRQCEFGRQMDAALEWK
jgi:hypothetical protein